MTKRLAHGLRRLLSRHLQQVFLVVVLVALCAGLSLASEYFLTPANLRNVLEANAYRLILAVGMTYMVASGVMDLSAGSSVSLCGVVMALCLTNGAPTGAAVAAGVACGVAIGAVNGALIHLSGINFFILTLAMNEIPEAERVSDHGILAQAVLFAHEAQARGEYFHPACNARLDELTHGRTSNLQLESLVANELLADAWA